MRGRIKPYVKSITPNMYNQGRWRKTMRYMDSGSHYQTKKREKTTRTTLRKVPATSEVAPNLSQANSYWRRSYNNFRRQFSQGKQQRTSGHACRNLTKQTAHIDVPKELSNVDSEKENRKRKRSLSIEFLFILLLQCLITLFFHFKRYQFFQRRI